MSAPFTDIEFRCMGCDMRVLVEGGTDPSAAAAAAEAFLHEADGRLSRFRHDSEISRLNDDVRTVVPVSSLLLRVLIAALDAADETDGLVVPTLLAEIEDAGYRESLDVTLSMPLQHVLDVAPPRQPARPDPDRLWTAVTIDLEAGLIGRPVGLRLDVTGAAKGVAADLAAQIVSAYRPERFFIDCAGDLAIGGSSGAHYEVAVEHPVSGEPVTEISAARGGVATSGINRRIWTGPDGLPRHHLLDPATGRPAWTGLAGATALAPTAAQADTIAKAALLAGPDTGRLLLRKHGGVLLHEDGTAEPVDLPRIRQLVTAQQLAGHMR